MMFSFHDGWDELHRQPPAVISIMLKLVLPFSLLPALMILYAGYANGGYYSAGADLSRWEDAATLFLIAELATVPLMAWVLQSIAGTKGLKAQYHDSFLLAASAALPLWLSSLVLFVPNLAFNLVGALLGLVASFAMLYHGLPSMFGTDEDIESMDLAYSALSAGGAAWAILVALVLLPLFGGL